ncbi:hypothetical protein Gpo141_00002986 [Globisporangium polare]
MNMQAGAGVANANMPAVTAAAAAAMGRGYPQAAEPELKQIPTEQVQAILDENSGLIVDIITLNNQIKHGKGTTQLSEFTDKLDKKRKQLNKNLMTLAKWADESSEQPPQRPVPPPQQQQQQQLQQQQQQQMYAPMQHPQMQYPRAMAMNPMAGAQQVSGQPGMAMNQAQAQAQAQARYAQAQAYAQYQARLSAMGGVHPQYAQMGQAAAAAVQAQQQRYHVGNMGYGNPVVQQQQQQQQQQQPMYDDGTGQMQYQQGWAPN